MKCKICASHADYFSSAEIMGKHTVEYFRCFECGFIFTEEPYWLEEAYSSAITGSDVGLVRRNYHLSKIARVLIATFFDSKGRFLDFAGGYGLFVRIMRDNGQDFRWFDRSCANLFAGGFAADLKDGRRYDLVTAFEVFEHLVDPIAGLDEILRCTGSILCTTDLLPEPAPKPDKWWYYGLEHGQHVSFYTRKSLEVLAEKKRLNFYTNGATVHLLTEKKISAPLFFLLARRKTAHLIAPLLINKSLLEDDYLTVTGREFR